MRMCGNEWILAEDHAETRTKFFLHVFQNGIQQATRRTLEVAKLLERDRRIGRSNGVGRLGASLRDIDRSRSWNVRLNRSIGNSGRWSRRCWRSSWTGQIPTCSQSDAEHREYDY